MSTDLTTTTTITTGTSLINFEEEFARISNEVQGALAAPKGNFISLKGRVFTLPDGRVAKELDCIVLDFIRINQLMPPYKPGVRAGATCWAMGRVEADMLPEHVPQPECELCSECPKNQFKSHSNGKGKACANRMRLVIVPPDATAESEFWLLHLPPTSLADWTNYTNMLRRTVGVAGFCRTVTKLRLSQDVDYPKLIFTALGPVADAGLILQLRARAEDALTISPSID